MPGVAVITGAGSGIGRASALALAVAGWSVALVGRRQAALEETLGLMADPGAGIAIAADVTIESAVEAAFDTILSRFGRIDFLFNNAGSFGGGAPFEESGFAAWRAIIDVNVNGAYLCARAAFRRMKGQSPAGGRIVNCGSISAHVPRPQSAAYTTSKHAITGLTRSISLDGRAWNIACGQIDIGNAATQLTSGFGAGALQADGSRMSEPMMEVGNVADAVLFMAGLPAGANVQFMTVMATNMPYIGRG